MKKWIVFIFVSLSVSYTLAQKNTIVTIDQKPISIEEFENIIPLVKGEF